METKQENSEKKNSFVYLDIDVGGEYEGRIIIELFESIAPKTCKNFKALCTGECERNGKKLSYKGSIFYRVMKGFIIQGGDIDNNDGTGGESIYGKYFDDETFEIKHEEGIVSMANNGKNTNGSQFFIVTDYDIAEIDGQNVAFGKVYSGMDIVKSIESQRTISIEGRGEKPIDDCVISDCGVWEEGMKKIGPEDGYPLYPRYYEAENPNYLEIAQEIKKDGNNKFCTSNYKSAVKAYKKALRYLMYFSYPSSEEGAEIANTFHKLSISLHLNQAASYIKMKDYEPAITECIIVLDHPKALKGDKIKANYRKGVCFFEQQKYQDALDSFKKASELDGGKDSAIKKYLREATAKVKEEKELLKNMSKGISETKDDEKSKTINFSLVPEDDAKDENDTEESKDNLDNEKVTEESKNEVNVKEA
ncbi:cyclophilin-like domain-containing protein [Neocallimastix lanati (nom. inval.)]|jgi:peptidyl-prolyl isomerase D|nr:cyclophilin-like domain-containing protein [Neocallimastix sp. JGI-2020a]